MILENEMLHGRLPRSRGIAPASPSPLLKGRGLGKGVRSLALSAYPPPPEHEGWGEWDVSLRVFGIQASDCPLATAPRIEKDTAIIPVLIAEQIGAEASSWLSEPLPHKWVLELANRAEVIYQHNARFRQLLRKPGDKGRDWLAAFMRHWLYALLASRRPDLAERLPRSFAIGRDFLSITSTLIAEL